MTPKPMSADTMVERQAWHAFTLAKQREADDFDALKAVLEAIGLERLEAEKRLWLPIESAPKDGDGILVEWFEGGTMLVVSWDDKQQRWATLDGLSYHPNAFKAWQALPEPSTLSSVGEKD